MLANYFEALKNGYCNEDGIIKEVFLTDYPKEIAKYFMEKPNPIYKCGMESWIITDAVSKCIELVDEENAAKKARIELFKVLGEIVSYVNNEDCVQDEFRVFFEENVHAIQRDCDVKAFWYHLETVDNYLLEKGKMMEDSEPENVDCETECDLADV